MLLKFIGEDKSMGLKQGTSYNVNVFLRNGYIWVEWGYHKVCPYDSPQKFAENWAKA